jgi:hypothetical protein
MEYMEWRDAIGHSTHEQASYTCYSWHYSPQQTIVELCLTEHAALDTGQRNVALFDGKLTLSYARKP